MIITNLIARSAMVNHTSASPYAFMSWSLIIFPYTYTETRATRGIVVG
jgi:hypothetical protein